MLRAIALALRVKEASRHFFDVASTPPQEEGNTRCATNRSWTTMDGGGRHLKNGVGASGPDAKNDDKNNVPQIRASAVPGGCDSDSSSGVHDVAWLQRAG